jgi:hypothetical protein
MKHKLFSAIVILSLVLGLFASVQPLQRVRAAGPTCYVDDTALGANDGSGWTDAFRDLQLALSDEDCTAIYVAEGTYYPTSGTDRVASFQLRNGLEMYGGFPDGGGTQDPDTHPTILSGDIGEPDDITDNSYHVVSALDVDASTVLDGFTISNGRADSVGSNGQGGGIFINAGSPTLRNLIFEDNYAAAGGGGMYDQGNPDLSNVVFTGNFSNGSGGGALIWGNPSLTDMTFRLQISVVE